MNTKVFRVEKFLSFELCPEVECVRILINFYLDILPYVLLSACCIFVCVVCTYRRMVKAEIRILRNVPNVAIQKSAVIIPELEVTIWSGNFQKLQLVFKFPFKPPDSIPLVHSCSQIFQSQLHGCCLGWTRQNDSLATTAA